MKPALRVATVLVAGIAHADPQPAAKPPHGAQHLSIDYRWQSFSRDERHYKLAWNGTAYTAGTRAIDPKLVDALYASLVKLRPAPDPLRCISHTDDYPAFTIAIDGDEPVAIDSESNCHAYVPWNVAIGGKHLVQFDGSIWRALAPILVAADDRWKRGGNSPMASTAMGGEMVLLGAYKASGVASGTPTGDAAACAHSLETNPQARAILGEPIAVSELELGCDLSASPECTTGESEATFAWQGLAARIDLPCTQGTVSLPRELVATLTELAGFVASKPVRTLVKVAHDPPRLWNNGEWNVESIGGGAPTLSWKPGTTTIGARSFGEPPSPAFWKALGIDVSRLVSSPADDSKLELQLDFRGNRVK